MYAPDPHSGFHAKRTAFSLPEHCSLVLFLVVAMGDVAADDATAFDVVDRGVMCRISGANRSRQHIKIKRHPDTEGMALSIVEVCSNRSGGNQKIVGRDLRFGGQGGKLHRRTRTVAVRIV